MVLADPKGSVLYEYVKSGKLNEAGSWAVEGIGEDFIPEIADMSLRDGSIRDRRPRKVSQQCVSCCVKKGSSAGLPRARSSPGRCVTAVNRRSRSASSPSWSIPGTNIFSRCTTISGWRNRALFIRPPHGDLSDLISHRYEAGEVISVGPSDTLLTAFKRMRDADVSQVPVVDQHGRAIGILDESDLLVKVHRDPSHFNDPVKNAMTSIAGNAVAERRRSRILLDVFDRGRVAIVMEDDKFLGLVTRSDLLSYLRLHMPKQ